MKSKLNHSFLISLTTSPERLKSISPVLEGFRSSDVILNLPFLFRHKDVYEDSQIDKIVKKFPNVKINRLEKDLGPQSKLLGSFDTFHNLKAYDAIVVIDDDTMYEPNILSRYDYSMSQQPNTVFTGKKVLSRGFTVAPGCRSYCIPLRDFDVNLFIEKSNLYSASSKSCSLHDDMVFAAAFQDLQYTVETALEFEGSEGIDTIQLPSGFGYDALHTLEHCIVKDNKCSLSIWAAREECSLDEQSDLQKNIKGLITEAIDITMSL